MIYDICSYLRCKVGKEAAELILSVAPRVENDRDLLVELVWMYIARGLWCSRRE